MKNIWKMKQYELVKYDKNNRVRVELDAFNLLYRLEEDAQSRRNSLLELLRTIETEKFEERPEIHILENGIIGIYKIKKENVHD